MAKIKTEFEIMANTLKAMAKQRTAKAKNGRAAMMAVFIDRVKELAFACDGYKLAILDMFGHMNPDEIVELAFYADMQSIEFANGFALVSAKKKETFVKNFGNGLIDIDTNDFKYPDILSIIPKVNWLNHISQTHACILPSSLQAIDKVVSAAEKNDELSVAVRLYGKSAMEMHIALYNKLIVGVMPEHVPQDFIEELPNENKYFEAIRFVPKFNPEGETEEIEEA